jgi:hypothetical protein
MEQKKSHDGRKTAQLGHIPQAGERLLTALSVKNCMGGGVISCLSSNCDKNSLKGQPSGLSETSCRPAGKNHSPKNRHNINSGIQSFKDSTLSGGTLPETFPCLQTTLSDNYGKMRPGVITGRSFRQMRRGGAFAYLLSLSGTVSAGRLIQKNNS